MRSQAARDEQTITIATALGIMVGGLVIAGLAVGVLNTVVDVPDRTQGVLGLSIAGLAGIAAVAYLVRHRRP